MDVISESCTILTNNKFERLGTSPVWIKYVGDYQIVVMTSDCGMVSAKAVRAGQDEHLAQVYLISLNSEWVKEKALIKFIQFIKDANGK